MKQVTYSKQAEKFLTKQPRQTQQRIIKAIHNLPQGDVKQLIGYPYKRLRVGDYRIFFDDNGNVTHIYKIGNRGDVYKNS